MINISFHQVIVYFILLIRVATIVVTAPFLGFESIPLQVKAGLSLLLALLLFPVIDQSHLRIPLEMVPFIVMIMNEVLIGMVIGFVMGIIFVGVQFAGELIGMDMGFGIVNILDPQTGDQVSLLGEFQYLVALLLFLSFDGHHFILQILKLSYEAVPIMGDNYTPSVVSQIVTMSNQIFSIGLKLGATALAALFITTVIMAIVSRLVPQMNIFIIGFPLKISVGFIMLVVSFPFFAYMFEKLFMVFQRDIVKMLQLI